MTRPIDRVLARLDRYKAYGRGQWMARCPAHDDRNPSLSIKEGDNGAVLLKCFAGCETADVVAAMGLEMSALFPPKDSASRGNSVVHRNFTRPPGERPERLPPIREDQPCEGPALERVPLANVMATPDGAWPHVMDYYLPCRAVTLLGGHGGLGKSMLALTLAAHVACGRGWGPFNVTQARVVFLSFEDEGAILLRRLRRIIEVYGLPPAEVSEGLAIFDGSDAETELAIESGDGRGLEFTPMMGLVSETARGAGLVIVDNASDTYGANEVARRMVRRFIRRLAQDAKANDGAVLLLAHIDKQAAKGNAQGNNYSGSTQWHNSVRSRLALVKSEERGIELLHEKANYGPTAEPVALQREAGGVLEHVSREAADAARATAQALMAQSDAEEVLRVLEGVLGDGQTVTTAMQGAATTWHVLCRVPELPKHFRDRPGRKRLEAALMALERGGAIFRETYKKPNRHEGERWRLAHQRQEKAA